ncbi:MAG: hypothetical protein AAGA48_03270 [Myxococcota bacterium]
MPPAASLRFAVLAVVLLLPSSQTWAVDNGDFANGLTDWQTETSPTTTPAGEVVMVDGSAELREGGAFLVSVKQTFAIPSSALTLKFDVVGLASDLSGDLLLDAFEASLVDAQGASLVPVHRAGTTSFLNRQEDGSGSTGTGVTVTEGTNVAHVSVNLAGIATGTQATFVASLINGDTDTGSRVRIDNVEIDTGIFDTDGCDYSFTVTGSDGALKRTNFNDVLSYTLTFTGTSGYYKLYKGDVAESGGSQKNESSYFRITNTTNPNGYPEASVANCGNDYIVQDYDNDGQISDRVYLGTFWLESGVTNTLEMRHYCDGTEVTCPQFLHPNETCNGSFNSVHFYTGTLTCGEDP